MRENFTITDKDSGKIYWISRSLAVTTILTREGENGSIEVLLQKRGPGCPDNIGKWCCSCGYLNWDETLKEAAIRELWEETGVRVNPEHLQPWKLVDDPGRDEKQNITQRFVGWLLEDDRNQELNTDTVSRGGEEGEISELKWVEISEILKMPSTDFAFGHREVLEELLNYIK